MNFPNQFIVAGIGTEIGKTVVSSILVEALEADYWKPIQSGGLEFTDSDNVKSLISNSKTYFWPEAYRLNEPLSPHAAAAIDGVEVQLEKFVLPQTSNRLVVELAGGLFVPLNNHQTNLDLIPRLGLPVVLVSRNYLGSINHTLLSVEALRTRNVPIAGLIFNGESTPASEDFIINYTQLEVLARFPMTQNVTAEWISEMARRVKN
jgi:dethiobiotin synthetase